MIDQFISKLSIYQYLGSQNEQMQRQLAESQRAAQLEFNSRLDEEAALEEAIKRSLQH